MAQAEPARTPPFADWFKVSRAGSDEPLFREIVVSRYVKQRKEDQGLDGIRKGSVVR